MAFNPDNEGCRPTSNPIWRHNDFSSELTKGENLMRIIPALAATGRHNVTNSLAGALIVGGRGEWRFAREGPISGGKAAFQFPPSV